MNAHRDRTIRHSFTLTELLVVIMVISILASSMLFAMYTAVEQAKESRTRAQIAKLHELLVSRWDSYRTRAIRLQGFPAQARRDARAVATARLLAFRDLMRMELPDRKADLFRADGTADGPFSYTLQYNTPSGTPATTPPFIVGRPAVFREYQRRVLVLPGGSATWTEEHEDAECLYMTVASMQDIMGNALDFFQETEIGDTDEDGLPEILDAWGNPLAFIRWAPGFLEHPGVDFNFGDDNDIPSYSSLHNLYTTDPVTGFVAADVSGCPDPFDPLRVDSRAAVDMDPDGAGSAQYYFGFSLYPLVCSAGADGAFDIIRRDYDPDDPTSRFFFDFYRTGSNPYCPPGWNAWPNDPYSVLPTCEKRLGEPFLESFGYKDNITNHAMGG